MKNQLKTKTHPLRIIDVIQDGDKTIVKFPLTADNSIETIMKTMFYNCGHGYTSYVSYLYNNSAYIISDIDSVNFMLKPLDAIYCNISGKVEETPLENYIITGDNVRVLTSAYVKILFSDEKETYVVKDATECEINILKDFSVNVKMKFLNKKDNLQIEKMSISFPQNISRVLSVNHDLNINIKESRLNYLSTYDSTIGYEFSGSL